MNSAFSPLFNGLITGHTSEGVASVKGVEAGLVEAGRTAPNSQACTWGPGSQSDVDFSQAVPTESWGPSVVGIITKG